MSRYTKAGFLQTPGLQTPVFVRFSTVAGSRGSTDLARDVRGFAVKPEQNNEIPQAASAHDTFWDFISLMPEYVPVGECQR